MDYKKEPIKNYPEYQIDTNGIIYGKKGHPLKYSLNHKGYCIINFIINGKRVGFGIHTLVATQWLDHDDEHWQVNHKDGNKQNNSLENLEWVTPKENVTHAINELNKDYSSVNNFWARGCIGIDKEGNILYDCDCIMDAAKIIAAKENLNPRYVQNKIWKVLSGRGKTYKGCIWKYK